MEIGKTKKMLLFFGVIVFSVFMLSGCIENPDNTKFLDQTYKKVTPATNQQGQNASAQNIQQQAPVRQVPKNEVAPKEKIDADGEVKDLDATMDGLDDDELSDKSLSDSDVGL